MRHATRYLVQACLFLVVLLIVTAALSKQSNRALEVDGHPGHANVMDIGGRLYVDLHALAQITHGSLSFRGERIILTLPAPRIGDSASEPSPEPPTASGLSRDFMRAGIEEIATMREWASTLEYAIQNGYHITDQWTANYREQAAHNLRLASAAVGTDDDRNALQLLTNEFGTLNQWSERLVQERKSMDTAKYALSDNALRNDPVSQKIINCGRFLATMLGSGRFQDDSACH